LMRASMKGSLQIGITDLPTEIKDIGGAPLSVITDTIEGAVNIFKGDWSKGAEKILPLALGNPLKAVREYREGVTTRTNAPVFYGAKPLKADMVDALLRFASFNPARIAGIRERQWSTKKIASKYWDMRSDISRLINRWMLMPGGDSKRAAWVDILAMITEYNTRLQHMGHLNIPAITGKNINANLRNANRPSKSERARAAQGKAY